VDGSARSLSQDSTIIAAPAKQNPDTARIGIQAQASTIRACSRMETAARAHITPKVRIWPTAPTSRGEIRQPAT
jgi:hypothetical protein